jgi:hypothetical protein
MIISKKYKEKLKHELLKYGIDHFGVYDDLEGLAKYIDWRWVNQRYDDVTQ